MRTHVTILAWLHIILGLPMLFGGAICFLFFGGAAAMLVHAAGPVGAILGFFGTGLFLFIALFALAHLALGWGLLQGDSWARILGIIMSILSLVFVPSFGIHTILGIYGLVILLNPETATMFDGPRMRSY